MSPSRNVWVVDQQHDLDYMLSEIDDVTTSPTGMDLNGVLMFPMQIETIFHRQSSKGLTVDELFYPQVPRRLSGSRDSVFHLCYGEVNNDSRFQRGCSDAEFEDVGWSEISNSEMISSRNVGAIDQQRDLDYMFSENKRCDKSNWHGWSEIPDVEMISSRNIWAIDEQRDLDYMFSENRRCDKKSNCHGWNEITCHVSERSTQNLFDAETKDLAEILGLTEENLFYLQMPKRLSASRDCGFLLCHSGFRRSCLNDDFEDPFDEIQDQLNGTKAWAEPCSDCNDIEQEIGDRHEFEDTVKFEDDASVEFEDAVEFQDDEFYDDHYQDCYEEFDCESV